MATNPNAAVEKLVGDVNYLTQIFGSFSNDAIEIVKRGSYEDMGEVGYRITNLQTGQRVAGEAIGRIQENLNIVAGENLASQVRARDAESGQILSDNLLSDFSSRTQKNIQDLQQQAIEGQGAKKDFEALLIMGALAFFFLR